MYIKCPPHFQKKKKKNSHYPYLNSKLFSFSKKKTDWEQTYTFLKNSFIDLQFTYLKCIINGFSRFYIKKKNNIKYTTNYF